MEPILEVCGLSKTYPGFSLKDISFSLPEGCITGLIGRNGAGKTTILRAILGLMPADSGTVRFFYTESPETGTRPGRAVRERLGIVLDGGGFYGDFSLEEMKNLTAAAYPSWDEDEYRRYLDRFSLRSRQKIRTLSKGMQMQYALALALSHHAEFLILDEPTSGLDPLIRAGILELLKEFMENGGRGVLFSTHITSDLDKIADLLILMDGGRLVFQEEKDLLLDRFRVVKGDPRDLNPAVEPLLGGITQTAFGFTAVTKQPDRLRALLPDCLLERPSIEDIMLHYLKGGK